MKMQIIKVPGINGLGKTKSSRNAGNAILAELRNVWSSEKGKPVETELLDLEEIHVNNSNLDEQEELIFENSLKAFSEQDKIIFLGGDHSISFSVGKAFLEHCNKNEEEACLIVFDSHADMMPAGKNPNHEEWLRALIESGWKAENVLLVGSRNNDKQEIEFLAQNKIRQVSINQLVNNIEETTDLIMEFGSGKQVYVSFDIDVIDAAFAPDTGYPEVGGLSSRQALYIVSRLAMMKNLKAVDIVEINCEKAGNMTVKLGARLLGELL